MAKRTVLTPNVEKTALGRAAGYVDTFKWQLKYISDAVTLRHWRLSYEEAQKAIETLQEYCAWLETWEELNIKGKQ